MKSSEDLYERRSKRQTDDPSSRNPTTRDRDRIIYSEGFRRLGGITQVVQGAVDSNLHNRLTHSLKVEQVGTAILGKLQSDSKLSSQIDIDSIRAACLAHDIGHPPFGHAGEQVLDELVVCETHRKSPRSFFERRDDPCPNCKLEDGFEGNAQTFRILTTLETHREPRTVGYGLDLTRATLQAVSKYPWLRGEELKYPYKWGAYDIDRQVLNWVQSDSERSIGAKFMDLADDIAYATHDIEDFFRIGRLPLADYMPESEQLREFFLYVNLSPIGPLSSTDKEKFIDFSTLLPSKRFEELSEDLRDLDKFRSRMLAQFIEPVQLINNELIRNPDQDRLLGIIKQLIWFHVISAPEVAYIQLGQQRVLREIFLTLEKIVLSAYPDSVGKGTDQLILRRLHPRLRRYINLLLFAPGIYTHKQRLYRSILDYISSLTDSEAYALHSRLKGVADAGHL